MEKPGRFVFAMVAFLGVVSILGIGAAPIDEARIDADQMPFWASLESAVRYFFAAGIAAVLARRSFVVPALSLAAVTWLTTTYSLYRIAQPAGVGLPEVVMSQLAGLVVLSIAVTSGALLGRWFYKREIEAVALAA